MIVRILVAGTAIIFAFTAPAAAADSALLQDMARCAALGDNGARLACYDALAPQVKAALGAPAAQPQTTPAPQVATRNPPPKEEQESWFGRNVGDMFGTGPEEQTTPQQFGAENTEAAKQAEAKAEEKHQVLDSISAGVTEYALNPFGKFVVFLDNGQIWKQIPGDADKAQFKTKATENKVTISRGLLGSYNLTLNDGNKLFKVTRIK